ncbi:MAG: hypothetical protein ACE1ZA_05735 [Pseudomonadales bacterium]
MAVKLAVENPQGNSGDFWQVIRYSYDHVNEIVKAVMAQWRTKADKQGGKDTMRTLPLEVSVARAVFLSKTGLEVHELLQIRAKGTAQNPGVLFGGVDEDDDA